VAGARAGAESGRCWSVYGENGLLKQIAKAIAASRRRRPVRRTGELAALVGCGRPTRETGEGSGDADVSGSTIHLNQELRIVASAAAGAHRAQIPMGALP